MRVSIKCEAMFWFLAVLSISALIRPSGSLGLTISNVAVHKVSLRRGDASSPYCYAASCALSLESHQNFLATQVWPASRAAASFLERNLPDESQRRSDMTICELGCGTGLPSLTAAAAGIGKVIATDLEPLALALVDAAAYDQGFHHSVKTQRIDLCGDELPPADLYLLSDVFESASVAEGAARLLHATNSCIWVFCQTDRAQREMFRNKFRKLLCDDSLDWVAMDDFDPNQRICLFDVDESLVSYG